MKTGETIIMNMLRDILENQVMYMRSDNKLSEKVQRLEEEIEALKGSRANFGRIRPNPYMKILKNR